MKSGEVGPRRHALTAAVLAYRTVHGFIAIVFLACIGYVWWCALSGRLGRMLRPAITGLIVEGVLVVINRGDCPLGPLGARVGDPVPLFELVLSPRRARRAVPTLGAITAAGLAVLAVRSLDTTAIHPDPVPRLRCNGTT